MFIFALLSPRRRYRVRWQLHRMMRRYSLKRISPLTWCVWLALAADMAAPGYLVFHIGFRQIDATTIRLDALAGLSRGLAERLHTLDLVSTEDEDTAPPTMGNPVQSKSGSGQRDDSIGDGP